MICLLKAQAKKPNQSLFAFSFLFIIVLDLVNDFHFHFFFYYSKLGYKATEVET